MATTKNPAISLIASVVVVFIIVFTAGKAWKKS